MGRHLRRGVGPGWASYYRYCIGAKRILSSLDWYVDYRLWLWLRGKHRRVSTRKLSASWRRVSRVHPGNQVWAEGGAGSRARYRGLAAGRAVTGGAFACLMRGRQGGSEWSG